MMTEGVRKTLLATTREPSVREWTLAGHVPKDHKKIRDQYLAEHLPLVSQALQEAFEEGSITQKLKAVELVLGYLWGKPQVEVNVSQDSAMVIDMIDEAKASFIKQVGQQTAGIRE